ncbi:MAG: tRNA 4-thiouridine(8) synthase ThiI [Kiritimatiellia bacterium]
MKNTAGKARGLSLFSGGLDSQLAVCVLRDQNVYVEGVVFKSPFFKITSALRSAEAMDLKIHVFDFTTDILQLLNNPPHGFGGNLNPCIDCHALMIKRAAEMMSEKGYDFIATGEVLNQRPMSQRRQAMDIVEKSSGLHGRLLRPLSALHFEPTIPEEEGLIDRSALLDLHGRNRKPQLELAHKFGLKNYPSPAGGCLLTEKGFCGKLSDMLNHEGFRNERLAWLLLTGRHLRLPGGSKCIIGRNSRDNARLKKIRQNNDVLVHTVDIPGPSALLPSGAVDEDITLAASICASYGDYGDRDRVVVRFRKGEESCDMTVPVIDRDNFREFIL